MKCKTEIKSNLRITKNEKNKNLCKMLTRRKFASEFVQLAHDCLSDKRCEDGCRYSESVNESNEIAENYRFVQLKS